MSDFPPQMGLWSLNRVSIVQPTREMKNKEAMLFNALIATPTLPCKPSINDIYTTIQSQIGPEHAPTTIMAYPPDFILQFSNPESRNIVCTYKTLHGNAFTLDLQPWTPNHRCLVIIPWNTRVTINIKGIPPHAFYPDTSNPLLASYCDIQTYQFNQEDGTCTVNTFAYSIESIPKQAYLALPRQNSNGKSMHVYAIAFETTTYTQGQAADNSTSSPNTAELFGVDPEVLQEAYEEQWRAQWKK